MLLRFSITCGLQKFKLNRQMRFSLPSIKCSAAPPCFRLLPSERLSNQIVEHSSDNIVGGWEEPPNTWLMAAKNAFVDWALNFGVRMLLKSAVIILGLDLSMLWETNGAEGGKSLSGIQGKARLSRSWRLAGSASASVKKIADHRECRKLLLIKPWFEQLRGVFRCAYKQRGLYPRGSYKPE